jgi:hypothetical protein
VKSYFRACLPFLAAALVMPVSLQGHHGWAEFDSGQEITLTGSVTDFHFVNPHCVVEFDAKDSKGQMRRWQGEFSSPGPMTRKGWTAASLQPGDTFTVVGNPAKNGAAAIHVLKIRLANGQEFVVDSSR